VHALVSTSPFAAVLVWGSLGFWMLAGPRPRRRERSPEVRSDRGTALLIIAATGLGVGLAFAAASTGRTAIPVSRWALLVVGLLLMWVGIGIAIWAVRTLGRLYRPIVAIQEGHDVVASGPYRFIRHPMYAGALLVMLGFGIALGSWLSIALSVLVPLPAYVRRIVVEERTLEENLGEPYRRYEEGKARLIPGLW
jgi:protein-S-isoprenylcysteine O-methyltransferase Ste14